MFKKEKDTIFLDVLSSTSGLILTFASFVLAIHFMGINFSQPFVVAFLSFIAGLFVDRVNDTSNRIKENNRIIGNYRNIIRSISNSFSVQKIIGKENIEKSILEKISSASSVRNTFLGSKNSTYSEYHTSDYVKESYKRFFANKGRKWIDIVGVPELYGGRYEEIESPTKNNPDHTVVVSRIVYPVINFTIIQYDDNEDLGEVFFGWNYSELSNENTVFWSSDSKIVEFFSDYFGTLQENSLDKIKVDYSQEYKIDRIKNPSKIMDRRGCWITIGYEKNDIRSIACFDIDFDKGKAIIVGKVIWKEKPSINGVKPGSEDFHHSKESISYTDKKIFLEYRSSTSQRQGVCVYIFDKIGNSEKVTGYIHDNDRDSRVQLAGIRIGERISGDYPLYYNKIKNVKSKFERLASNENLEINWKEFGL